MSTTNRGDRARLRAFALALAALSGSCTQNGGKNSNTRPTEGGIGVPGYIISDKVLVSVTGSGTGTELEIKGPAGSIVSTTPGVGADKLSLRLLDGTSSDLYAVQAGESNWGTAVVPGSIRAAADGSINLKVPWKDPGGGTRFAGLYVAESESDGDLGNVVLSSVPQKPSVAFAEARDLVTSGLNRCLSPEESRWSAPVLLHSAVMIMSPRLKLDSGGNGLAIWKQLSGPVATAGTHVQILASRYTVAGGFSPPVVLIDGNIAADLPNLTMRPDGHAVLTWTTQTNQIWAARFSPLTGWMAPIQVSPTGVNASSGNAYPTPLGFFSVYLVNRSNVWFRSFQGSVPSSPVLLESGTHSQPMIGMATNDVGAIAWLGPLFGPTLRRVVDGALVGANVSLADTTNANANIVYSQEPQITSDAQGNSLLVWSSYTSPTQQAPALRGSYFHQTNGFQPVIGFDIGGFAPQLTSGASLVPSFTLSLSLTDFLRVNKFDLATGWTRVGLPPGASVSSRRYQFGMEPTSSNGSMASDARANGEYRFTVARYEAGQWLPCTELEKGVGELSIDQPAIGASGGKSVILWGREIPNDSREIVNLYFSRYE